jgi:hypothetical protein
MKVAVRGRMASEEIGAPDPRITHPITAQSPPPTETYPGAGRRANRDGGVWDDSAVRVMTVRRFGLLWLSQLQQQQHQRKADLADAMGTAGEQLQTSAETMRQVIRTPRQRVRTPKQAL